MEMFLQRKSKHDVGVSSARYFFEFELERIAVCTCYCHDLLSRAQSVKKAIVCSKGMENCANQQEIHPDGMIRALPAGIGVFLIKVCSCFCP